MANVKGDVDSITSQLQGTSLPKDSGVSFVGKGLKLDKPEDAKTIVDEIKSSERVEFLNMEGNSLGVDAAKEISKALENRKEFKKALWKDMFTSRLKTEIPVALKHLTGSLMIAGAKIEVLDLSDNASGPIGVEGFEDFLRSPSCYSLRELRLNNMGLGVTGAKKLANALQDLYNNSKNAGEPLKLEVFIAGRNRLENPGATALAQVFQKIGTLKEIQIPQNGIYHVGVSALSDAFNENLSLEIINLNDNTVTEKGAKSLSKVLHKLTNLKQLDLGDCLLRTEGATSIAQSISSLEKLESLNLSFNEIKGEAGLMIMDSISSMAPTLSSLYLDGNQFGPDVTDELYARAKELKLPLGSLSDDEGDDGEEDDHGDDDEEDEEDDEDLDDEEEEYQEDTESDQPYNIGLQKNKKEEQKKTPDKTEEEVDLVATLLESLHMVSPPSCKVQNSSSNLDEVKESQYLENTSINSPLKNIPLIKEVNDNTNTEMEINTPFKVDSKSLENQGNQNNELAMLIDVEDKALSISDILCSADVNVPQGSEIILPQSENKVCVQLTENFISPQSEKILVSSQLEEMIVEIKPESSQIIVESQSEKSINGSVVSELIADQQSVKTISESQLQDVFAELQSEVIAEPKPAETIVDPQSENAISAQKLSKDETSTEPLSKTNETFKNSSNTLNYVSFTENQSDNLSGSYVLVPEYPPSQSGLTDSDNNKSISNISENSDQTEQKDLISINSSQNSSYQEMDREESIESFHELMNELKSIPAPVFDSDDHVNPDPAELRSTLGSVDVDQAKNCIIL